MAAILIGDPMESRPLTFPRSKVKSSKLEKGERTYLAYVYLSKNKDFYPVKGRAEVKSREK